MALIGCRGTQSGSGKNTDLETWADEILGSGNIISLNETRTFALCYQDPSGDHALRKYKYLVVRLADRTIVREGIFRIGSVGWAGDESIEVISSSTSVREGSTKKIIHVTSPVE